MMAKTLVDKLTETAEGRRLYQQERALGDLTELACNIACELGVSRAELARRLKRKKRYVDRLLDGGIPDIRAIVDLFTVLGLVLRFEVVPLEKRE